MRRLTDQRKKKKSIVSCERMNEKKHPFLYKTFLSIFLYLKGNSAFENVLPNNQYRQKNQTDAKNKKAESNYE